MAGVAGGLYAHLIQFIQPDNFASAKSTDYIVYLYAGGVGTISGSIFGAVLLTILPELLRFLNDWRLVIYALPVSYTHLDVYKRQDFNSTDSHLIGGGRDLKGVGGDGFTDMHGMSCPVRIGIRCKFHGHLAVFCHKIAVDPYPVSYTHLDVYKRQI